MKRKINRHISFIAALAVATAAFASPGFTQDKAQIDFAEHQILAEALRKGGLKEAARIKGDYVMTYDPFWHTPTLDLKGLTKKSGLIVTGIPVNNRCRLTLDGFIVLTVYDVLVTEVLKGDDVKAGQTIKVALPGGKVRFKDGTSAEVRTPDFQQMSNNKTYALYLYEKLAQSGHIFKDPSIVVHRLTSGPHGLLELSEDGKRVKSHARPDDPIAIETKDISVEDFLKRAREEARK